MTLTADQERAQDAILTFLADPTKQCFVLQGYAGVGKTYLIQHVEQSHKALLQLMACTGTTSQTKWHYTATTHKAAQQLQAATGHVVTTIHALLRLRLKPDYKRGTHVLEAATTQLIENAIIVIDEASYVDYALLTIITDNYPTCKIIFMGDPTQLTPVGLNHAPVFLQRFDTYALTQVVRQQGNHPLLPVFEQFRSFITGKTTQLPRITPCSELVRMNRPEALVELTKEFTDPSWECTQSRILAWRNKTVITYNTLLFDKANNRKHYAVGDILINNHALPKVRTDEEVQILSVQPVVSCGVHGCSYRVVGASGSSYVFVPDKPSDYTRRKNKAVKENNYSDISTIMDTWADLRPPYASTVNKAQGSTFDRVFIDLDDMRGIKDVNQLARLLYVAMSRAKQQVIFIGDL